MRLIQIIRKLTPEVDNYTEIGVQALIDLLDVSRGSQFIATTTLTIPEYRKTACPFRDNLYKLDRRIYHINSPYKNMVNNQRKREGLPADFVPEQRTWGGRVIGPPFVVGLKDANFHLYLEAKIHQELGHTYLTGDGETIPEAAIDPFIRKRGPRPHQGTEHPTELRNIAIEHILTLVAENKGYTLNVNK